MFCVYFSANRMSTAEDKAETAAGAGQEAAGLQSGWHGGRGKCSQHPHAPVLQEERQLRGQAVHQWILLVCSAYHWAVRSRHQRQRGGIQTRLQLRSGR